MFAEQQYQETVEKVSRETRNSNRFQPVASNTSAETDFSDGQTVENDSVQKTLQLWEQQYLEAVAEARQETGNSESRQSNTATEFNSPNVEQVTESSEQAKGEHGTTDIDLLVQQMREVIEEATEPNFTQSELAEIGEALLSVGIMPTAEYLEAMEIDEPRARGYQSVMRMALEDSPARQQAAEIVDRIRAEVEAREKQTSHGNAGTDGAEKATTTLVKAFTMNMEKSGYIVKGFENYTGDAEMLNQMQTAFSQLAKDFPDVANGLTVQLSKMDDRNTFGWFDAGTDSIHYNRELFRNWNSMQEEYTALVNKGHFPAGTDARGYFYHEFGHAVGEARRVNYKKLTTETMVELGMGYGNPPHISAKAAEGKLPSLLSKYSASWSRKAFEEVIAECFSEWYTSGETRDFCKIFLRKAGFI